MYRLKFRIFFILSFLVSFNAVYCQFTDLNCVFYNQDGDFVHYLFQKNGNNFNRIEDAFSAQTAELEGNYPTLTVSGDFDNDGMDEIAMFYKLGYTPNMNPAFSCSVIMVFKSQGNKLLPVGTWFSVIDTAFNFDYVKLAVAGDFNQDGKSDIAVFYNDINSEKQSIYVFESTGSGFSSPKEYFTTTRDEFNFSTLKFAVAADFTQDDKTDIAVFYNYFGDKPNTKQSIFVFKSEGTSFSLLPSYFNTTKVVMDFSSLRFAVPGDYNYDKKTDIAVLYDDPVSLAQSIYVFKNNNHSFDTVTYFKTTKSNFDFSNVSFALPGHFATDTTSDIAVYYNNPVSGSQDIMTFACDGASFKPPSTVYSATKSDFPFTNISAAVSGKFIYQPLISATTWKNDKKGAISFTFDDGAIGAFIYAAPCLDSVNLKATFFVFTDTTSIYDAPLASLGLMREYQNKGFEIGSHTVDHDNLGQLTADQNFQGVTDALCNAVTTLNQRFNQKTFSLSIPFGSFRYETLPYLAKYFYTARSSQYGYNLATPFDFYTLKSRPVLSSTLPSFIDSLVANTEKYGYYLPLMYHNILNEPFNADSLIYTVSLDNFKQTVDLVTKRDVWIDTYQNVYKYIRERNAVKHTIATSSDEKFSFISDDNLNDSIFNVDLTLKIKLPAFLSGDSVTVIKGDYAKNVKVISVLESNYIYYNSVPNRTPISISKKVNTSINTIPNKSEKVEGIRFYASPNPFLDYTLLKVEGQTHAGMCIVIRDISGRTVQPLTKFDSNGFRVDRSKLGAGIYIVQLFDSGSMVATMKLIAL